ncbi:Autophagy-related protein 2 [Aphelenchoides besseyi]|nr:Autophagy-related protein 2 [Aphelenchoides besseyi]
MEFVDEVLEAIEQQQAREPVTQQPTSLYSATDLSKLLHIQGIKIFTDIWTNSRDNSSMNSSQDLGYNDSVKLTANISEQSMVSSSFQSCYSTFNESRRQPPTTSSNESNSLATCPIQIAQIYGEKSTVKLQINNAALNQAGFNKKFAVKLEIGGAAFGLLSPSQLSLITDLLAKLAPSTDGNPSGTAGGQPMQTEHFDAVNNELLRHPMISGGLAETSFIPATSAPSSNALHHHFANPDKFYEIQSRTYQRRSASVCTPTSTNFTNVPLDSRLDCDHRRHGSGSATGGDSDSLTERGTQHGSNSTLTEKRPDLLHFDMKLPALYLFVTHDDPLSSETLGAMANGNENTLSATDIRTQIAALRERADEFFHKATHHIPISAQLLAADVERDACARLYVQDHLRVVARNATLSLHSEFNTARNLYDFHVKCYEADVCEYLMASSQVKRESDGSYTTASKARHFDIFNFNVPTQVDAGTKRKRRTTTDDDEHPDTAQKPTSPNLHFEIQNRERESQHRAQLRLGACKTHFDLSIVDRLHNLIQPRPFMPIFAATLSGLLNTTDSNSQLSGQSEVLKGLVDDERFLYGPSGVFAGLADSTFSAATPAPTTYAFQLQCPRWTVEMRIPRADYSSEAPNFKCKNLHDEMLRLQFTDARLEVDAFEPSAIIQRGQITISCATLSGDFRSADITVKQPESEFFHATSKSTVDGVKIRVNYDTRNKELRLSNNPARSSVNDYLMSRSMHESMYFRAPAEDQIEGPFSKSNRYFDGERLVSAGSRKELQEFAADCQKNATVNIALELSSLNLYLSSHDFLELLYNRFANDLALWSLRAPVFNQDERDAQLRSIIAPLADDLLSELKQSEMFSECRQDAMTCSVYVDKSIGNQSVADSTDDRSDKSHRLALSLKADECRVLMQMIVSPQMKTEDQLVPDDDFKAQLLVELTRGQFFLVHEYNGVPHLDYAFVSAGRTRVLHRNLLNGTIGFASDVKDANFCGTRHRSDLQAEPNKEDYTPPVDQYMANASERHHSGGQMDEDALAVGLKIHSTEGSRKITVAVALRNTLIHLKPVLNPAHHWSQQFVSFFSLVDYEVPGYVWPKMELDAHIQLQNLAIGYDHCNVVPESPMIVRFVIGSCHLSARYEQARCYTNLTCLLESTRLYAAKRPPLSTQRVQFTGADKSTISGSPSTARRHHSTTSAGARCRFVKALEIGLVHVKLEAELPDDVNMQPSIQIQSSNNEITMWTCADTIIELVRMYDEFQVSDIGRTLRQHCTANPPVTTPAPPTTVSPFESESIAQIPESISSAANLAAVSSETPSQFGQSFASQPSLRTRTSTSSLGSVGTSATLGANASAKQLLTPRVQEKLMSEISAAMREDAKPFSQNSQQKLVESSPFMQPNDLNSDEEFEMLDEMPGSGITNAAGDPKVRFFDKTEDGEHEGFIFVQNYFPQPTEEPTTEIKLPLGHPPPLWQVIVKDCNIRVLLYGGNDFGDNPPEQNQRSKWQDARDSRDCMREGSEGGIYRDHTVCVEARVTKMSFVYKSFSPIAPTRSLMQYTVGNVEILDHLIVSQIDKFLYHFVDSVLPPRLHTPLFLLKVLEDQSSDCKLKVSLLPLRFNLDQDTVEFLLDFITQCGREVKLTTEEVVDDTPEAVMEIGVGEEEERPQPQIPTTTSGASLFSASEPQTQPAASAVNFHFEEPTVVFRKNDKSSDEDDRQKETKEDVVAILQNNPFSMNEFDPYDESDVFPVDDENPFTSPLMSETQVTSTAPPAPPTRGGSQRSSRTSLHSVSSAISPIKQRRPSAQSNTGIAIPASSLVDDPFNPGSAPFSGIPLRESSSSASVAESTCTSATSGTQRLLRVQTREPFFKEIIFSPQCVICFDYVPKHMTNTQHGAFVGFLMGVVDMKRTQLTLRELHNRRGVLGYRKLSEYMRNEWESDIAQQWGNLLSSYGPIQSLVEIFRGSCDLIFYPMAEMQRTDGRLVRGLQRGASSFTKSAAIAAIDAGQQVLSMVQGTFEFSVDMVTSEEEARRRQNAQRGDHPEDLREGIHRASRTLMDGVNDIRSQWSKAMQETRAQYAENPHAVSAYGWGGGRALWRQVIPTMLKPLVYAPIAMNQMLDGFRAEIRPEESREEREKWRQPSKRRQQQQRASWHSSNVRRVSGPKR